MIRIVPKYIDHLWYPILVRVGGYSRIVEMRGKDVNSWNDMIEENNRSNNGKPYRYAYCSGPGRSLG